MTAYLWVLFVFFVCSFITNLLTMQAHDADSIDGVCTVRDAALLAWTIYLLAQP